MYACVCVCMCMPLYVYAMYVYTACADPASYMADDFHVYRFADTHPSAGRRIQKLRLDEPFKVPRIYGFRMPTASADPERNALCLSVLFRAFAAKADSPWDQVAALEVLLDGKGSFVAPWKAHFAHQLRLAERFHTLQERAGDLLDALGK